MERELDRDEVVFALATASTATKGRPGVGLDDGQAIKPTGLSDD